MYAHSAVEIKLGNRTALAGKGSTALALIQADSARISQTTWCSVYNSEMQCAAIYSTGCEIVKSLWYHELPMDGITPWACYTLMWGNGFQDLPTNVMKISSNQLYSQYPGYWVYHSTVRCGILIGLVIKLQFLKVGRVKQIYIVVHFHIPVVTKNLIILT